MITNERQYKITKAQIAKFSDALSRFNEIDLARQGIDPMIIGAQRASLEQQLSDLRTDLSKYEKLRSGEIKRLPIPDVARLGEKLIEARIVQGLSQRELAERLGMKEQQVQRYEQERYSAANLMRLAEVAEALRVELHARFEVRQPSLFDRLVPNHRENIDFDPAKLPVKEMKKRGWLEELRLSNIDLPDAELAAMFVLEASGGRRTPSLHHQQVRAGAKQDNHALMAWKAQVLRKAKRLGIEGGRSHDLDIPTFRTLVELSAREDGPEQAVRLLRDRRVAVVFEERLPSTYLDGAAMLLDDNLPVVALTLRLDRIDNFWFVLLHECAHVFLHRERGLRDGFFDVNDEEAPLIEAVEKEADEFARNTFIANEVWQDSFVRFTGSSDAVIQFAKKNKVGVPVVAGRIRRERQDYTLFNELVGQGKAKSQIKRAGYWES